MYGFRVPLNCSAEELQFEEIIISNNMTRGKLAIKFLTPREDYLIPRQRAISSLISLLVMLLLCNIMKVSRVVCWSVLNAV